MRAVCFCMQNAIQMPSASAQGAPKMQGLVAQHGATCNRRRQYWRNCVTTAAEVYTQSLLSMEVPVEQGCNSGDEEKKSRGSHRRILARSIFLVTEKRALELDHHAESTRTHIKTTPHMSTDEVNLPPLVAILRAGWDLPEAKW